MNRATLESQWLQIREILKEKFSNLTEEDIKEINGRYDQLVAKLQQKYGYSREEAEERIMSWNFDRNARLAKDSVFREDKAYYQEKARAKEDNSSILKWLLALGIPLLLLGAYLLSPFTPTQKPATPVVTQESVFIEAPADRAISNDLRNTLLSSSSMVNQIQNVQITTRDGVVTLTGYVPSREASTFIERTAETFPGVRSVINNLQVR